MDPPTGAGPGSGRGPKDGLLHHPDDGYPRSHSPAPTPPFHFPPSSPPPSISRPWRPAYLSVATLLSFAVLFGALAAVLEVLLAVSDRNQGIATSGPGPHYLWTYGPAALVTLLAAAWGRVAFQAQLVAPWCNMAGGAGGGGGSGEAGGKVAAGRGAKRHAAGRTLFLDYMAHPPVAVVFSAWWRGDRAVGGAVGVALIFNVLVVAATGLMTLTLTTRANAQAEITLQNEFADAPDNLGVAGSLDLFTMVGLVNGTLAYPAGTTPDLAFQTWDESGLPFGAEVRATVDGFVPGLECDAAELTLVTTDLAFGNIDPGVMTDTKVQLRTPACRMDAFYRQYYKPASGHFGHFATGQCDGLQGLDANRIGFVFADMTSVVHGPGFYNTTVSAVVDRAAAVVCRPTYRIARVDVVRNGSATLRAAVNADDAAPPSPRMFAGVHPWDIMQAHLDSYNATLSDRAVFGIITTIGGQNINVDRPTEMVYNNGVPPSTNIARLLDPEFLKVAVTEYYAKFATQVAHRALMQQATTPATAVTVQNELRVVVRPLATHLMAALLFVSLVLAVVVCLSVPRAAVVPEDPSTIIGLASLISHSPDVLGPLGHVGSSAAGGLGILARMRQMLYFTRPTGYRCIEIVSADDAAASAAATVSEKQDGSSTDNNAASKPGRRKHHFQWPLVLRLWPRLLACLLMAGMIGGLEASLRASQQGNGLGDVADDAYIHYVWTIVPAAALGLLALYLTSVDFETRVLTPFLNMTAAARGGKQPRGGATFAKSVGLDLLNGIWPVIFVREVSAGTVAAMVSTLTMLVASLFTVFSGSLFSAVPVDYTAPLSLRVTGSFSRLGGIDGGNDWNQYSYGGIAPVMSSLILGSNLSYPDFTYDDLAFPAFVLPDLASTNLSQLVGLDPAAAASAVASLRINATVPAIRSYLTCRMYSTAAGTVHTNLTLNYTIPGVDFLSPRTNPLRVDVDGEGCGKDARNERKASNAYFDTATVPDAAAGGARYTPPRAVFALNSRDPAAISRIDGNAVEACSDFLYIWGRFDIPASASAAPDIFVAAMGCNETVEVVDVDVSLVAVHTNGVATSVTPGASGGIYAGGGPHSNSSSSNGTDNGAATSPYQLRIDTSSAPRPVPDTARWSAVPEGFLANSSSGTWRKLELYMHLADVTQRLDSLGDPVNATGSRPYSLVDVFSTYLTTSPRAIPLADLADPSPTAIAKVAAAIKVQHALLRAQDVSANHRAPTRPDVVYADRDYFKTLLGGPPPNPLLTVAAQDRYLAGQELKQPALEAQDPFQNLTADVKDRLFHYDATAASTRLRVVQDAAATRLLQALLGAALVGVAVGILLGPRTGGGGLGWKHANGGADESPPFGFGAGPLGKALGGPRSVAAGAALVAGGNLLDAVRGDGVGQGGGGLREMAGQLKGKSFFMGWKTVEAGMEETAVETAGGGGGARGNDHIGERRFGIWVVDDGEHLAGPESKNASSVEVKHVANGSVRLVEDRIE